MFSKLFKRKEPAKIATTPPGEQLFAIGDVHGRLDLLNELLAIILADCHDQARRGIRSHIVMLGDYVDRGQSSAQVVERLMALQEEWPETILLRGNHEQIMLEVLGERPDLETFESWLHYGGRETLISYGLTLQDVFNENSQLILNKARRAIPQAHVEWMSRLKTTGSAETIISPMPAFAPASRLRNSVRTTCCGSANRFYPRGRISAWSSSMATASRTASMIDRTGSASTPALCLRRPDRRAPDRRRQPQLRRHPGAHPGLKARG
ncbi:serine/threonine protein phosphatase [Hankyongella ginsenosidimutans]|uniref:Serine/threonine protein phosphatase n=1 Tax=Hankyongella ginsenosidimutans TaxID=1763828 RepID=A0A4D7C8T8_9SPHN|nr:metallophosphoesterase [Hankyongella ginsenosidimutans]QCI79203.1 serine/threonine protein phosphatase [Hankyongella ginsenosidimutans]